MLRAAAVIALAGIGATAHGEDPAPADPPKAVSWHVESARNLAVSPDGAWLAAWTPKSRCMLFPTDGGPAVPLDDDDEPASNPVFTADSAWVITTASAPSIYLKGTAEKRTQTVHLFPTRAPDRPKRIVLQLRMKEMPEEVRKRLPPEKRGMKNLDGKVLGMLPLSGTRVLFDRGAEGTEVWEVASQTKYAASPTLDGPWSCGLSPDGSRCVVVTAKTLEIRNVKQNRVVQSIPLRRESGSRMTAVHRPRFTRDGTRILAMRSEIDRSAPLDAHPYTLQCWAAQDGKLLWSATLGVCSTSPSLDVAASHAIVNADERLVVLDLLDGKEVALAGASGVVHSAASSHDGTAAWICGADRLYRVGLPRREGD
jgi:hypothetical protein